MKQRYVSWAIAGLVVIVIGVIIVQQIPSQEARLLRNVEKAIQAGDLDQAEERLATLVDVTKDSIDQTALESLRLSFLAARIARENQLLLEYSELAEMMFGDEQAAQQLHMRVDELNERISEYIDEMTEMARTYQTRYYQEGLRLNSPLRGEMLLPDHTAELDEAYSAIMLGDDTEKDHDVLFDVASMNVMATVLDLVIVQNGASSTQTVSLSGTIDIPEVLWLIGSSITNPRLAEWYMLRIVDETEHDKSHPARQRASEVLSDALRR